MSSPVGRRGLVEFGGWKRQKYVSRDHELYLGELAKWLQIGINQVHVFSF